jgi:hypothetical protein
MMFFGASKRKQEERLAMIKALRLVPEQIGEEVKGLSEEELRFRPGGDQWSLKEVVGHLRDFAEIDHDRLCRMIGEERPLLPGYDQETLVRERNYQEADLQAVLNELASFRRQTVQVLTELADADWLRTGQHEERGVYNVRQLAEQLVGHETMHLEHIRALKLQATA